MKISGTNSYIKVKFDDDYEMIITGELALGRFYAEKSSMIQWQQPYSNQLITESKKQQLIEQIEEYTKNAAIKVLFD